MLDINELQLENQKPYTLTLPDRELQIVWSEKPVCNCHYGAHVKWLGDKEYMGEINYFAETLEKVVEFWNKWEGKFNG